MRVRFGGTWIADSENVLLLFEPGRYPMAYFKEADVSPGTLQHTGHTTRHPDLGLTSWYAVDAGDKTAARGAWQHTDLPDYASELQGRIAFAWPAIDAFYEEDERIMGHAADSYRRIDIRQSSRNLVVRDIGDAHLAAWSYRDAYYPVGRISNLVSFEPDIVSVQLDGMRLRLEPGQTVIPHGPDRDLDIPAAAGNQP
jgi:uncharacterized protein (DUF427 family)